MAAEPEKNEVRNPLTPILFVDDDPNILAAYKRQLRTQFPVDTAPGGEQGLEEITHRGPYAVVVSDLRMPGMDGIEFLSRVRRVGTATDSRLRCATSS